MTIKVISIKKKNKVQHWDFVEGRAVPLSSYNNTIAAVTAGSSVFRFALYKELSSQIEEGKFYVIRNHGISKFGSPCMMSKEDSNLLLSSY